MHLLSTGNLSGAEKIALDICMNLDKSKFEPYAVCAGKNLYNSFLNNNIKSYVIDTGKLNPLNILKLKKLVKRENIDIIHAHDTRASIAAGIAKGHNTIVISHIHGNYEWLGRSSYIKYVDYMFRKNYDLSISCSKYVNDNLIKYYKNLDKSKIKLISNCVDFNKINESSIVDKAAFKYKAGIPDNKYVIGYVGRLVDIKGVDLLIESYSQFCKTYNDTILLIAGDGEEKEKLKELVNKYNINENVIFTGFIDNIYNYLDIMDVFILPSKSEGLSIALMEAMAKGRIVITSKTDGVDEIIKNGETGIILYERSYNCLLDAMVYVYKNKEVLSIIGSNAAEFIKNNYDIKIYIKKIEEAYESLIEDKKSLR